MAKENAKYLEQLRSVMKEKGVDAVIISGTDPHQSENPPAHWRGREWLTGFWSVNGTNGTAVVTQDKALCWTDSRYFLQATEQLKGTGFEMMEEDGLNAVDLIDWVTEHMNAGQTVAIDGTCFSISQAQRMQQEFSDNGIKFDTEFPLFDYIWKDRPGRPDNKLFLHKEEFVGESAADKTDRIMKEVKGELANAIMLSALDDIAWATNVRAANDIAFSPIYVSYLYLDEAGKKVLFVDSEKVTDEVREYLTKNGFEILPYDSVFEFVSKLPKETRLLIDPAKTSRAMYDNIGCTPVFGGSKVAKLKSIKNETMLKNIRIAMEKDGVALVKFFMWVEKEYPKGQLTEITLSKKLRELRLSDPTCVDESFCAILGWNGNGAIVHYEPEEETCAAVVGDGLLLVDSGGQYMQGTTDITRTIALGTPTAEQIHDFTLVMKGHITISEAKFIEGTRGHQLDAMARMPLWKEGKAYYHGTGHGVGYFINCHEGPQSIRLNDTMAALEPGMLTSNEPGLYLANRYGIRCENIEAVVPYMETEFGKFYQFETLTLFPFDLRMFETAIMSDAEIDWLNNYHAKVRERLTPYLNEEEAAWLADKTRELKR